MQNKRCKKTAPSFVEMLQRRIAEQQYEFGVSPLALLVDYLIAMGLLGSKCPRCHIKLAKDTQRAIIHLRHKHHEYYVSMLERLILKEIPHIKHMKALEIEHAKQRKRDMYYEKLPVYFAPPEPYQIMTE